MGRRRRARRSSTTSPVAASTNVTPVGVGDRDPRHVLDRQAGEPAVVDRRLDVRPARRRRRSRRRSMPLGRRASRASYVAASPPRSSASTAAAAAGSSTAPGASVDDGAVPPGAKSGDRRRARSCRGPRRRSRRASRSRSSSVATSSDRAVVGHEQLAIEPSTWPNADGGATSAAVARLRDAVERGQRRTSRIVAVRRADEEPVADRVERQRARARGSGP